MSQATGDDGATDNSKALVPSNFLGHDEAPEEAPSVEAPDNSTESEAPPKLAA